MTKPEPLTAAVVTERLRMLAELSARTPESTSPVDMSSVAVTNRLLECAEISALVWVLGGATRD